MKIVYQILIVKIAKRHLTIQRLEGNMAFENLEIRGKQYCSSDLGLIGLSAWIAPGGAAGGDMGVSADSREDRGRGQPDWEGAGYAMAQQIISWTNINIRLQVQSNIEVSTRALCRPFLKQNTHSQELFQKKGNFSKYW